MKIQRFEDLIAWKKGQDYAVIIYEAFASLKDFGFIDQIRRAAISISNNIAEGFDRSSKAEFSRFLYYALGSCSETKSMLYLATRLNYLLAEKAESLIEISSEISRIITGLLKSIRPLTTDH